ncbi:MAG: hypothetical protein ACI90V_013819 [Bacillariaceae sp.]|jgi:hypothetical protein
MQWSPLIMMVALSQERRQTVYSKRKVADMDQVGVFRALL